MEPMKMYSTDLNDFATLEEDLQGENCILIKNGFFLNFGIAPSSNKHRVKMTSRLHDHSLFLDAEQYLELVQVTSELCDEEAIDRKKEKLERIERSAFDRLIKIGSQMDFIHNVMKRNEVVEEFQLNEISEKLITRLNNMIVHLRQDSNKSETMILLVEKEQRTSFYVQLLEGLLLTNDIYPFLLDNGIDENELFQIATYCNASSICVIGEAYETLQRRDSHVELLHTRQHQIQGLVKSFVDNTDQYIDIKKMLKTFREDVLIRI